jgi:2-polyprenyl-3-methyl-5-hydroxy-6-metoxy-1,4-benzoquinol methylase
MNNQDFTKTFLNHIQPGHHVLDLGAGDGKFAQMFVERGAKVTAVDTRPMNINDAMIVPKQMTIEYFCATENKEHFDLIFVRNAIQFLDKNWTLETFLPWMEERCSDKGIIVIETFYQDPEPPFDHPMRSLYTLKELTGFFMSWNELFAREYDHVGLDLSGNTRKFFITSLIVQKAG